MKYILIVCFLSGSVWAKKHSQQSKHEHGHAEVSIAFELGHAMISLDTPAESLLGFEHEAKSESDKKKEADVYQRIESHFSEVIVFDPKLKCQFLKDKIKRKIQGHHSDIHVSFHVQCEKEPTGTSVTFHFQKYFPGLKEVKVQLITEKIQKGIDVEKNGVSLEVK